MSAPEKPTSEVAELAEGLVGGQRRALARAITLIESVKPSHRKDALELLSRVRQETGDNSKQALRIGLSGTPGVGKSTFIESFGMMLVNKGLRVAVLAVDPSSARSGGSILGDKTRMSLLSRAPNAFIRPSPSSNTLGGVARRTREAVTLCEAAGYDVILIETVGVGQSETMVAGVSDIFLLLMAPAGGDELQGVKRGIMEIADIIVVNKADGDLKQAATRTCADYAGALRLLRKRARDPDGFPKAMLASALEEEGIADVWEEIETLANWRKESGVWDKARASQAADWFQQEVEAGLLAQLTESETIRNLMQNYRSNVSDGTVSPSVAAENLLKALKTTG
ncbi:MULTISPECIES: methylmalonyl Co-A mutase-associated GTPase MeaB [Halocynthiibacter]|uniref:Methylmalonyl Co-A mutase-associated GTPase MeaB n=1 Tax=Halocynthiibacter halioticoli TaxID=2986804 RepID=A0AAE3IZI9_9RHOB|nr:MULTISPECIES: methylmalonyl Co-A mutase-associated GTPase MeaB [Halocynthiibacter]MCV6825217.1 methylmalonyl Co-A mutase-associated GTPase MeaB [Halocynthiibacter halioticoli]MCW4058218.1 methylmalonyl Co-A mutase-associated GTPase MeaB [Halocynthiibacter sp. SDUM655004]